MKKRLWLIIPWAAFVLIAGGWVLYWFAVAGAAEGQLARWSESQRAAGGEVSYAAVKRHSFPVLMRLELDDVRYRPPRARWTSATARVDLNIDLLDTGHVILEYKAPIEIAHADSSTSTLAAQSMVASLHTRGAALVQAGIEANALTFSGSAKPGQLRAAHAVVNVRPDPRAAGQYQAALTASAITLARPVRSFETFGNDIADLQAGIVFERGAALLTPQPDDALRPWREAGGKARFEFLSLTWGPLQATGTGEAAIDDQRRLVGHLRVELPHPGPALEALSHSDNIPHDAKRALELLSIGFALSGRHVSIDVDARDGSLRIENTPVRTLDPLY